MPVGPMVFILVGSLVVHATCPVQKVTLNMTSYQRMRKPCEVHAHLALSAELMVHKPNLALQLRTCIKRFVLICMLHLHVHNHVCSSNDSSYPNCTKLAIPIPCNISFVLLIFESRAIRISFIETLNISM